MILDRRFLFTGLLSVLLVAALAMPTQAQIPSGKLGVSIGGTLETMDDLDAGNTTASFGQELGFHFGASYEQLLGTSGPLSSLAVRPGIYGRRIGEYSFPNSLEGRADFLLEGRDFTVWSIEIPLDIKYGFDLENTPITPYVLVGPQLSILRGEEDFQEALEDVSYSVNFGAGTEIELPLNLTLMPEFRYEFGASDVFGDQSTQRFRDFNVSDPPSIGGAHLRVHLFYQLY